MTPVRITAFTVKNDEGGRDGVPDLGVMRILTDQAEARASAPPTISSISLVIAA
jgi:hypothetical protein